MPELKGSIFICLICHRYSFILNLNLMSRTWMEDQDLVDVDVNDDDDYDELDEEVVRKAY